ncbi:hypothetical protein [Helicobacter bilis]|nr:hypothetical protein [Helicobacter bilis]
MNLARFFTLQTHDILLLDTDPQRSVFYGIHVVMIKGCR